MGCTKRTSAILKTLAQHLDAYVSGTAPQQLEQRREQRVIDIAPPTFPPGIQRLSNACGTPLANNPTSMRILQTKPQTHLCETRANTPGALPQITQATLIKPIPATTSPPPPSAKRTCIAATRKVCTMSTKSTKTPQRSNRLALLRLPNTRLISQEAIAHLITTEQTNNVLPFTPSNLCKYRPSPQDFEHYAMPMIHPDTSESISSYKCLMNNPATADTWMTAFGKDFGGMSQGNNKTEQPGTNATFIMLPSDIPNIPKDRVITYARVVINHCPQKADPNQIQITAGGNLINYPG